MSRYCPRIRTQRAEHTVERACFSPRHTPTAPHEISSRWDARVVKGNDLNQHESISSNIIWQSPPGFKSLSHLLLAELFVVAAQARMADGARGRESESRISEFRGVVYVRCVCLRVVYARHAIRCHACARMMGIRTPVMPDLRNRESPPQADPIPLQD